MVSVVKSGTAIRYQIEPGVGGHPMTAHTVSVKVTVGGAETYAGDFLFADALTAGVNLPPSATQISSGRAFAIATYDFKDVDGNLISSVATEIVVESDNLLVVGENSFASYQELIVESFNMTDLATFKGASKEEQIAALITAYYNAGSMSVSFFNHRHLIDPLSIMPADMAKIGSTRSLTADQISKLKPEVVKQLVRCQLAEADSLLGGNPIERQRILGLLSHAAGESTHFYRTSKPLELPISKRAAVELRGIINYALRIGR